MRKLYWGVLAVWVCTFAANAQVPAGLKISQEAQALFNMEEFAAVDQMAETFMNTGARTTSGNWKLPYVYAQIRSSFFGDRDDAAHWQRFDEATATFLVSSPDSSTSTILRAQFLYAKAWSYRGESRSGDVQSEMWAPFRENLHLAKDVLYARADQMKDNPHWYVTAIAIEGSLGARSQGFYDLIYEGIERYPAYYPIYYAAARFMDKRWSGDSERNERFARFAVQSSHETEGAGLYARVYLALHRTYSSKYNMFLFFSPDWEYMKASMRDVLIRYPDDWNSQVFLLIACMKQDADFAAEMLTHVTQPPIDEFWSGMFSYETCSTPNFGRITETELYARMAQGLLFMVLLELGYQPLPR